MVYKFIKNIIYTLLFIFQIVTLFSCAKATDASDLDFKYKDFIVVDGTITTQKKEHEVVLYHSLKFGGSDSAQMVSGATVTISNTDTIVTLIEKNAGHYFTSPDFKGVVNKDYNLDIILPDGKTLNASCHLYPSLIVDKITAISQPDNYSIWLKAHSEKGKGSSCFMNLYVNDSLITKKVEDKEFYAKGVIDDEIFNVSANLLKKDTCWIGVEINSIPYQMYNYVNDIKNETIWSIEPFRTYPANVRTNISEGGLGFFLASDVVLNKIQIIRTPQK
jgi:hypothetical protein